MKHFVCEVFRTGDYQISTPLGLVIETGTCKEEPDEEGRVKINPNAAWSALIRRVRGD